MTWFQQFKVTSSIYLRRPTEKQDDQKGDGTARKKMEADAMLKESQSELHRIKTEIAAGRYISIEEVKMDYSKFFVVFKKFAMALPSRIIGMISGALEPAESRRVEKEIADEINRLLGAFVIAGIVGPEDAKEEKKRGTKKKKDPDTKV